MIGRTFATILTLLCATSAALADGPLPFAALAKSFESEARPLLKRYCLKCHSAEALEGDLDLEQFTTIDQIRRSTKIWQKVVEMLDNGEMPPKKSPQPAPLDRAKLRGWARSFLDAEALANAGDPGNVVFRRLSNVEYDNTVRDLTSIDLKPAREFPVDGAAGEGFTNVGEALSISPSLIDKYVAAAKGIASHVVLLPDGIRFSEKTTRRDWTDELMGRIRALYYPYTVAEGSRRVNLQGLDILAETGGRIPIEAYLTALKANPKDLKTAAKEAGLSPKYLKTLSDLLNGNDPSALIDDVQERWRTAKPADIPAIAADIRLWQTALTKFNSVAHFKPWMEPVNPIDESQTFRIALTPAKGSKDVVVRLVTKNVDATDATGLVAWNQPRLEAPGRPPILLRDLRDGLRGREAMRKTFVDTAKYLVAADDARGGASVVDVDAFAKERSLDPVMLSAWFNYLGIVRQEQLTLDGLFTEKSESAGAFGFVKSWGPSATPNVSANSSDKPVSIPGTIKPHSVAMHPSPTLNVAVGWRSRVEGLAKIEAKVIHAHAACGNGVTWSLELRRGRERRRLAGGSLDLGKTAKIDPIENLALLPGDLLSIVIGARDANHSCDLTEIDLTIQEQGGAKRKWNLAHDVSGDLLAANPHADTFGNRDVWSFYTEKASVTPNASVAGIPVGSILDRWRDHQSRAERDKLATQVQTLLTTAPTAGPDVALYQQLTSPNGPLLGRLDFARLAAEIQAKGEDSATPDAPGLPRERFGNRPSGRPVDPTTLIAKGSEVIEFRLPADLAAGSEFIVTAAFADTEGSVQPRVVVGPDPIAPGLAAGSPILAKSGTESKRRVEKSFDDFRRIFPAALCYSKIVPVDEVVTLVLFHREDEPLQRLMLDEAECRTLDRLWDDLRYISQDAIKVQEAYGQFMEYVTQDGDVRIFEPLRKPIKARSDALRKRLLDTEPRHLDALIEFASRAYRRPLESSESAGLRALYATLRTQDLDHEAAFRLTLARVLMAPSFLYHVETSASGKSARPVSDWELASRLSYTLWSSMPDDELRRLAANGTLHTPDVLTSQVRRMLADPKARAHATEFACQWLDVRGFDTHDEKSDRVFPEFAGLRGAMYEESILFFVDMFKNNGSLLGVINADHTFVNESLAKHYGIPGVKGPEWRRVDGVNRFGRGGILGMASLLSKQSGASRTSPILRGNWLSEMLLGERLPRPPKDVPQLPESEFDTNGLTLREITAKHSAIESCAKCHDKIDAFGFALEGFDAIGRRRTVDLAGRPIDTKAKLKNGIEFTDVAGLRSYLLTNRRDEFVRHFCRKLLGYSLGRSVQLSDEPLLDEIRKALIDNDYKIQAAILTVVRSPQFLSRRGIDSPLDQEQSNP